MAQLRKTVAAGIGIVIGIITLRRLRKRRSKSAEPEVSEEHHEEAETASEHAEAAAKHARIAAEKAVSSRKEEQ